MYRQGGSTTVRQRMPALTPQEQIEVSIYATERTIARYRNEAYRARMLGRAGAEKQSLRMVEKFEARLEELMAEANALTEVR